MLFLSEDFCFLNKLFSKKSFRNATRGSNSLDADQARHFVGPNILSGLTWVQTVCKGYQQTTRVVTSGERELILSLAEFQLESFDMDLPSCSLFSFSLWKTQENWHAFTISKFC